jgi:hypothetical protein
MNVKVNPFTGNLQLSELKKAKDYADALLSNMIQQPFSWGDVFPILLTPILANKAVLKVDVVIINPFDAISTLSVGDNEDTSRLLSIEDNDLMVAGSYQTNPAHVYLSNTNINLYINIGVGNTTGNGIILVYLQE